MSDTSPWLGCDIVELVECDSTNDEAARLARAGARHGTVVIAHAQRAGRGRDGHTWSSPAGLGLYLSAVVRPPLPLADIPPMTLAIGIGTCDAARAAGATGAQLKWPNDVLVHHRKLGGILVETQSQGGRLDAVIVGIGLNLLAGLPGELAATSIALSEASATPVHRESVIASLLSHVAAWIDRYVAGGLDAIVPAWHARMARGLTARATVDGQPITGELAGLDRDGSLLLTDASGRIHRVRSGDVAVLR